MAGLTLTDQSAQAETVAGLQGTLVYGKDAVGIKVFWVVWMCSYPNENMLALGWKHGAPPVKDFTSKMPPEWWIIVAEGSSKPNELEVQAAQEVMQSMLRESVL